MEDLPPEALEQLGDGYAVVRGGRVEHCGESLASLVGSPPREVEDRGLSELLLGEVPDGLLDCDASGDSYSLRLDGGGSGAVPVEADVAELDRGEEGGLLLLFRELAEDHAPWDRGKLKEVVEGSPDFVSTSKPDEEEQVKYLNPAGRRLMGLPEEGPLPDEYLRIDAYHPDWALKKVRDEGRPVAEEEGTWVGETALLTADGEEIPVRQTLVVHEDVDGGFFSTIIHDISVLREREAEMARQRDRAERLFESAGNVMVELDADGDVRRINERGCELLGYGCDELSGENWFETVLPDEVREEAEEVFERLLAGETEGVEVHVNPVEAGDGDRKSIKWHNTVIRDGSGEPEAVLSSGLDVTERRELEERLRESRERFRRLVENIEEDYFFYRHDVDGVFTYLSPSLENILGYTREEFERHYSTYMTDSPVNEGVDDRTRGTLNGEKQPPYEVEIEAKDGSVKRLKVLEFPVESDGEVVAVEGIAQDITRRVRYERRLEEQKEQLELLNRLVRHDIRNDMQLVLSMTNVLEKYVEEDGMEYLKSAQKRSRHTVEITQTAREVLDSIASGDGAGLKPMSLDTVLKKQVTETERSHEGVAVEVDGGIPEVEVEADEMLDSIFRNILNNAVQHNDEKRPKVEVSTEVEEDGVTVTVSDNGPGVPDHRKEKIFGKEEKGLDSRGTGLGLYLVSTLVSKYGGDVWIEDNEPRGSSVNVQLNRA